MKTMKNFILLLALTLGFAACEKDEDKIYLSSLEAGELVATESNVVLLQENSKDIVLSLAWTKDVLQISDPGLSAIDVTIQTLQVSTTEDFSGVVNESSENSLSKAYTGAALNALAKSIGATPDVANNVYFRLAARTGNNMIPVYSNIVKVSVTPYTIDMSMGYILNTDKEETGVVLYSDASDGDYKGFMGLTPWYNFYLKEGNGAVWGNDGVTGTAFVLSSEDDDEKRWNCWSPGIGGCYYVDVNVNTKLWSAFYIPSLTLAGDLSGEMTFDRPNTKWTYAFNAVQAGNITLQISGTGKLYDSSTGTDDAAAKNTPVAFVQSGESLIFGAQAGNVTVNVPAVGECTLTIDLSNPKQWTVEVSSGSAEPEPEPEPARETLYMLGISEGEGGWNFNHHLRLYNEDNLGYAGVADVNAPWGYQIGIEDGDWDAVYTLDGGDADAGTLAFEVGDGAVNIPAPDGGLYFFDVSLKALTYNSKALGSDIYIAGLNKLKDEDWTFEPLPAASAIGVFSGSITITQPSAWGFKIYLFDGNWDYVYGGSAGKLYYKGADGITDDATLAPGTYTLTVDLINATYTIE